MSYQHSRYGFARSSNTSRGDFKDAHHEALSTDEAPQRVWLPVLVPAAAFYPNHPNWGYPTAYYDQGAHWQATASPSQAAPADAREVVEQRPQPALPAPESCNAAEDDGLSDASTDVGEGEDLADDFDEEVEAAPTRISRRVDVTPVPQRPSMFAKLTRQQRVDQLKRVVEEYCTSEFDAVDSTCQEGLVCRMLTTLKSLSETATFHGEHGRTEEKRISLLGLDQNDEKAIADIAKCAQELVEGRCFRKAFEVLTEATPRLKGEIAPPAAESHSVAAEASQAHAEAALQPVTRSEMTPEEVEAMIQRRLEKRQRQREERRVQRAADRADRATARQQNMSSGDPASDGTRRKWTKKTC